MLIIVFFVVITNLQIIHSLITPFKIVFRVSREILIIVIQSDKIGILEYERIKILEARGMKAPAQDPI